MRFVPLLAASTAGACAALGLARAALLQLPRPSAATAPALLALEQRWALNPSRRREAALLRAGLSKADPRQQLQLLRAQGWGTAPIAAVALKQQGLALAALGRPEQAEALWQQLLKRHAAVPASADALYALGQRRALLARWPAHPAALAAASERGDRQGALHLARWGARWPGAAARLSAACNAPQLGPAQRQQLAQGLAELGASEDSGRCLAGTPALPETALLLGKADLHDRNAELQQRGASRLLQLIERKPNTTQAVAAVRLLAADDSPAAQQALENLPDRWQASAAVQASRARQRTDTAAAIAVVQRWPRDPASWELQWQLARRSALAGRWRDALVLLEAGGAPLLERMPAALQARRSFWLGLSHQHLGQQAEARRHWQHLQQRWPGGYYGWRAAVRLGRDGTVASGSPSQPWESWSPLASGDAIVDQLWRVGQPLEAWEHWRATRRGRAADQSRELLAEGRLREAIGDGWAGLGQQELAALRVPADACRLHQQIERNRFRPRQRQPLGEAARAERVPLPLLLGVAKQESRFQSAVRSVVGAQGLLQLMPETAAEVHGSALSTAQLHDPRLNARLGARYLRQLLQRWAGNTILAAASYNAGPNAVARWLTPVLERTPELWVEAIPYPETRHYVKTVLGNSWSFAAPRQARCR